jgi:hypothetical protein
VERDELERLEADLEAVAARAPLSPRWVDLEPRVRRALSRPARGLAWVVLLTATCAVAGWWIPNAWLVAGGLLLAAVPRRVREVRERRRALAQADEGDLFALLRRELELQRAGHFVRALLHVALALLFGVVAVFAHDPRPGLIVAGVLVVSAALHLLWRMPRAHRALVALGEDGSRS